MIKSLKHLFERRPEWLDVEQEWKCRRGEHDFGFNPFLGTSFCRYCGQCSCCLEGPMSKRGIKVWDEDGYRQREFYWRKAYLYEKTGRVTLTLGDDTVYFFDPRDHMYFRATIAKLVLDRLEEAEPGDTIGYKNMKFRVLSEAEVHDLLGGQDWKFCYDGESFERLIKLEKMGYT